MKNQDDDGEYKEGGLDHLDSSDASSPKLGAQRTLYYYYNLVKVNSISLTKDQQSTLLKELKVCESDVRKAVIVDTLCKANLKLVYKIAKSYSYNEDSLLNYISAGNEGLLKAIEKYQDGKAPFPNYAPLWIKQRILHELYNASLLKVPLWRIKSFIKIKLVLAEFKAKNEEEPSDEVLAALVDIPEKNVSELRNDSYLKKILDRSNEDTELPIQVITEESSMHSSKLRVDGEPSVEQDNIRDVINSALEYLTNEKKFVIQGCFGLLDGNKKKLHQIGAVLNRTSERVRQIRNEGLDDLRKLLKAAGITEEDFR